MRIEIYIRSTYIMYAFARYVVSVSSVVRGAFLKDFRPFLIS